MPRRFNQHRRKTCALNVRVSCKTFAKRLRNLVCAAQRGNLELIRPICGGDYRRRKSTIRLRRNVRALTYSTFFVMCRVNMTQGT